MTSEDTHVSLIPNFDEIIAGMYEAFHRFFERPDRAYFASRSYHLQRKLFEAIAARNAEQQMPKRCFQFAEAIAARNAEQAAQVTHQILGITEEDIKRAINEQKH